MRTHWLLGALLASGTVAGAQVAAVVPAAHHLVACAPGYPGSTAQAQPTMDEFAVMVADAAGWNRDTLTAEYHEREEAGVERLRAEATDLALVPLPFFLEHEQSLQLSPVLQVVQQGGESTETWSLVAASGHVTAPADLSGWEIAGIPAYAPGFIRGPMLGAWGPLPVDARIVFERRVLAALRRAIAGESVAVVLDGAQSSALASLPGADKLEIIARSEPLIGAVVATVGGRIAAEQVEQLVQGLLDVHQQPRFGEVLETLRLQRFMRLDLEALDRARAAYLGS